jgi:immunomodulating metalloprotease
MPIAPVPADPLAAAVASGNASAVSLPVVMAAAKNQLIAQKQVVANTRQALLGLNADGSANAATLAGIDWNPGKDSGYFTLLDKGRNNTLLPANWRYSDSKAGTGRAIAVTGQDPATGARYAAFGGNPMAIPGNANMDQLLKNTVAWLAGQSSGSKLKVVTAHLPGTATYWFPHEAKVRNWITTQLPGVTINGQLGTQPTADDICDGDKLDACLQGANLLVLGREQSRNDGSSPPAGSPAGYISDTVMQAVERAQQRGVAVLYLHHFYDNTELSSRLLAHMGLQLNSNYFGIEGLNAFNPASLATAADPASALLDLLQRLDTVSFSTTWADCVKNVGKVSCSGDAAFTGEFANTATALRSDLRALDAQGKPLFAQPGFALEKLLVLLGDKFRESVSYPMTKETSGNDFFKAYFSDMAAYINRPHTTVARNLGNFSSLFPATTPVVSRLITVSAPEVGKSVFMSGLYVMPGRTITITRTDTGTSTVQVGLNMLRDTTRVFQTYDRPTQIASPRMALQSGKPLTITSPFGGPLYLFLGSMAGAPTVKVQVDGVITHPVLRNVNDPAQVAAFKAEVASTPTNWVGITTDFLTVHSNLTNFRKTLANYGDDITKLSSNIWTYMIKDTYELAGFNSATAGTFGLPASVTAFCNSAGWDCTGLQHRRDVMQHVISDNYAACGSGCSGNPYDQDWPLEPLGWGETHEIGHNLQTGRTKIYGGRSGEVSNNLFPTHKLMAFNKANPSAKPLTRGGTSAKLGFDIIKAGLATADPTAYAYDKIWSNSAYAADNGLRLSFYRQLVEHARTYNTGLTDGWELYTLIYLMERNVNNSINKGTWAAEASKYGFGSYTLDAMKTIDGNDFMLIASSRIIGRDMRPVFSMWGVTTSAAANAQVVTNGAPAADKLLFPMDDVAAYGAGVKPALNMTATTVYP